MRMLRTLALILLLGAAPAPELPHFAIERPAALNGRPVGGHLPIVHATVAGRPGVFLFDTGANATVLAPRFADALALPQRNGISGHDSAGQGVTGTAVRDVEIVIGDVHRRLANVAVVPIGALEALGLDGVISPQSLAGPDCLRIDFGQGMATLAPPASPACTLTGAAVPIGPDNRPHITLSGAQFLLDSGAWRTSLPAGFAPDAPALGGEAHGGVGGSVTTSTLVGPVTLAINGRDLRLESVARAAPGKPGVIGFDLLSRAVLLIRPGRDALLTLDR
jgi:hypothetical protein